MLYILNSFLRKRKDIDRSIVITANPGFQFIIIFKKIHTYGVACAIKGSNAGETVIVHLKYFHLIAAITGYK